MQASLSNQDEGKLLVSSDRVVCWTKGSVFLEVSKSVSRYSWMKSTTQHNNESVTASLNIMVSQISAYHVKYLNEFINVGFSTI